MNGATNFGAKLKHAGARLGPAARTTRVRAIVAAAFVVFHLAAMIAFGATRFHVPWNSAPNDPPRLDDPSAESEPKHWNRLVFARRDSEHYENIALRGYASCPARSHASTAPIVPTMRCNLAFYPGYSLLGYVASFGGRLPIDFALLAISIASAFLFFFLWTSEPIMGALGVDGAYASLLVFNAFTTAFAVVTIQTEAAVLVCALGSFVATSRDRRWLGAILAGAASGVRITGLAVTIAFVAGEIADLVRSRDVSLRALSPRIARSVVAGWGALAMASYHAIVFGDPLLYVHAHERSFSAQAHGAGLFAIDTRTLLRSIDGPLHEGVWIAVVLLFLAAGHRLALQRFASKDRAFLYALTAATLAIGLGGSASLRFAGMNRYLLLVIPAFFAMGKLLVRRPFALALWIVLSFWHYWQVDLCDFVGDRGIETTRRCHFATCAEP